MADNHPNQKDDLTFADLIKTSERFVRKSLRLWYVYVITFLVIGGFNIYKALTTDPEYKATITLMRDDDDGGSVSGVMSVIGQFGLGNRSTFNLDRVLELAKSRRIITQMLFDSARIDGVDGYLANHVIDEYELDEDWADSKPALEGIRFSHADVTKFSDLELDALRRVYGFVVGSEKREGRISASYSQLSSIISLFAITTNEDLSIEMINSLFDNLVEYYVTSTTAKQERTFRIVKSKADSIRGVLQQAEVEYAQFRDANQNLFSNVDRLKAERLSRDITRMNIIYSEALKNVEVADFALKSATPVVKELDRPVPPLRPIKPSLVKSAVMAIFLSIFVAIAWILGVMFITRVREVINE